jgi:hypothetical protein
MPDQVTCKSRNSQPGPWKHGEGLDHWRTEKNGDRCCSFCGSLHPDDFMRLVTQAAEDGSDVQIEPSDKSYKVYVSRPSVPNASEGGIKFYKWHTPENVSDEQQATYRQAIRKSDERAKARFTKYAQE